MAMSCPTKAAVVNVMVKRRGSDHVRYDRAEVPMGQSGAGPPHSSDEAG